MINKIKNTKTINNILNNITKTKLMKFVLILQFNFGGKNFKIVIIKTKKKNKKGDNDLWGN